jgi:hypothetical protein
MIIHRLTIQPKHDQPRSDADSKWGRVSTEYIPYEKNLQPEQASGRHNLIEDHSTTVLASGYQEDSPTTSSSRKNTVSIARSRIILRDFDIPMAAEVPVRDLERDILV